jgi:hypothetical protein
MAESNAHRLRGLFNRILSVPPPATILPKVSIIRGDRTDRVHSLGELKFNFDVTAMRFQRPTVVEIAILAVVLCMLAWLITDTLMGELAERRGARDAKADLAKGVVVYRLRGLSRSWQQEAKKVAWDRYGVQIIRTGGCIAGDSDWYYDMAYNRIVDEHLTKQLGFNPIGKVFDDAHDAWLNQAAAEPN